MRIYTSIKSTLAALSFAGMTIASSQAFAGYGALTFSPSTLNATAGSNYSQTLTAYTDFGSNPGNYNFSFTGNTDGLTVTNPGGGLELLVSGTPTSTGTFQFTIFGNNNYYSYIGGYNYNSTLESNGQEFTLNVSAPGGGVAPEMNASLIPQVALMLACLFFLLGRKKEVVEPMLAV